MAEGVRVAMLAVLLLVIDATCCCITSVMHRCCCNGRDNYAMSATTYIGDNEDQNYYCYERHDC